MGTRLALEKTEERAGEYEGIPSIVSCFKGKGGVPFAGVCNAMGDEFHEREDKKKDKTIIFLSPEC